MKQCEKMETHFLTKTMRKQIHTKTKRELLCKKQTLDAFTKSGNKLHLMHLLTLIVKENIQKAN